MHYGPFCLLLLLAIAATCVNSSDVLDLDVANFEKLTKVASGHTTGDWLVKFYAPWCEHSKKMGPILEEVAQELKGAVTVARVDVMSNRDVGTRFGIKGFPTIMLFSQGHMYTFKGRRSPEEIIEFARGGFQIHEPEIAPKEMGLFGELFLVSRHAYKEATKDLLNGDYYTANVFCVAMPIIFGVLLLIVLSIPFPAINRTTMEPLDRDNRSRTTEKQSDIPISRRARQPTSSTDSYQKRSEKDK